MRKLKLQIQQTVNGFVGGPKGEMDWMNWEMGSDSIKYVMDLHEEVDCIVMGRKLAEGFIPYWANEVNNPRSPQLDFARKMNDTPKVVFSKTLDKSQWENAQLAKGDLVEAINELKNRPGGDIIVYGGATFVSNLIHEGLIDEFHLVINPTAIGNGLTIFKQTTRLKLVKAVQLSTGKVVLHYEPLQ